MFGFARWTNRVAVVAMMGVMATGCALQETKPLDVRRTEVAPIRTIAIATIATRPSLSFPLFTGNRGELVRVLGKYEDELTNALLNQGFNVIPVGQSSLIYNAGNLEYEVSYLHNTPDYMARSRGEEELTGVARKLRADSDKMIGRRDDKRMFMDDHDKTDQLTSPNTRIFPEIGLNYRMMLPRFTENGGALDNRFMSDASRMAIGEITRDMGADAYLLIDANLVLSARQEGYVLTGLTGGSRYATLDGTAALVRNDGSILGVDWFRSQSVLPVGGTTQVPFTTERATGIHGFHQPMDQYTLLEGSYQAIRVAALDLAARYSKYRDEGRQILAKAEAERLAAAAEAAKAARALEESAAQRK